MIATTTAPELVTERLILRPLAATDAEPMTPLADDIGVARMTTSIPHPFSLDMAQGFIERMQKADPAREVALAIEHRREGFIGVLGFHPREGLSPELGYWIGRPWWGAGYMTEAAGAAVRWAEAEWGRRVLVSGHFADNDASSGVLVKTGFLYTGEVEWRFSVARGEEAATRMMVRLG